jgi:hypothetical protein
LCAPNLYVARDRLAGSSHRLVPGVLHQLADFLGQGHESEHRVHEPAFYPLRPASCVLRLLSGRRLGAESKKRGAQERARKQDAGRRTQD